MDRQEAVNIVQWVGKILSKATVVGAFTITIIGTTITVIVKSPHTGTIWEETTIILLSTVRATVALIVTITKTETKASTNVEASMRVLTEKKESVVANHMETVTITTGTSTLHLETTLVTTTIATSVLKTTDRTTTSIRTSRIIITVSSSNLIPTSGASVRINPTTIVNQLIGSRLPEAVITTITSRITLHSSMVDVVGATMVIIAVLLLLTSLISEWVK